MIDRTPRRLALRHEGGRTTPPGRGSWAEDAAGAAAILGLTAVATRDLLRDGMPITADLACFFYPMSSFLGERLRQLALPGWNPHQFAGAPFAADPQSGWGYLPGMLLYALGPLEQAAKGHLLFHQALAGLGTYALGRTVGLDVGGALVAAVAYEFSGGLHSLAIANYSYTQVAAWSPTLLLCAERALAAGSSSSRIGWWGVTGFALSQILASWLGQGAYYSLLALGGYVAWRAPTDPHLRRLPARLVWQTRHGGAMLLCGAGLAAAGLLPRLEYLSRSNLGRGYTGAESWAAVKGGWNLRRGDKTFLALAGYYVGGATAALALLAPALAKGRFATPYFALLTATGYLLGSTTATPLHRLLYRLLPRFEEIHRHFPDRVTVVLHLGPALLAGATVTTLARRPDRPPLAAALAVLPAGALLLAKSRGLALPATTERAGLGAAALVAIAALTPSPALRRPVPWLLVALLFGDLLAGRRHTHQLLAKRGSSTILDFASYQRLDGAARFLRSRTAAEPARFFGFDPALATWDDLWQTSFLYLLRFADPRAAALQVNNRATLLRLYDVQGYNPVQSQRYVEYMAALNGEAQGYHQANVLPGGVASPLLDLLNARYLVVPVADPAGGGGVTSREGRRRQRLRERPRRNPRAATAPHPAVAQLRDRYPTVYQDDQAAVLENQAALPRAWIVHGARQVAPGEALTLLGSGAVDPRQVALLEAPPPSLDRPGEGAAESVEIVSYDPDRLRLRARLEAAGLVVLSEAYDPAWRAAVDGVPTPVYVADHVLRAVPVHAGDHEIELRYQSLPLRIGTAVSLAVAAGLATVALAAGRRRSRIDAR